MKSRIYILLLSLICTQSALYPAAAELNLINNERPLIRHIAQDIQFASGIAAGFLVPKLIDSRGGNGIKYATDIRWETNDIVDTFMHIGTSFFTNTTHATKNGADYTKITEKTSAAFAKGAFNTILINSFKTYRAIPNCSSSRLIEEQGYTVAGGAAGAAISAYAYNVFMEHSMLPYLRSTLPSDEYDALPIIYQSPSTLTKMLIPLAIIGSSHFALQETLWPRMAFGDNLKITIFRALERANNNYTEALWDESDKTGIINLLTPAASIMSSVVPIPTSISRGMAFGQLSYLLYTLLAQHKEIFASSRFVKAAALISGSTLLARMGWLAYKQHQSVNAAQAFPVAQHPAA
jgi:hypothetical protein